MTQPANYPSQAMPVDKSSAAYQLGYADADAHKWNSIHRMWGGLGVFLCFMVIFVLFFGPYLYGEYKADQIKHDKVRACSHAADVTACIQSIGP